MVFCRPRLYYFVNVFGVNTLMAFAQMLWRFNDLLISRRWYRTVTGLSYVELYSPLWPTIWPEYPNALTRLVLSGLMFKNVWFVTWSLCALKSAMLIQRHPLHWVLISLAEKANRHEFTSLRDCHYFTTVVNIICQCPCHSHIMSFLRPQRTTVNYCICIYTRHHATSNRNKTS